MHGRKKADYAKRTDAEKEATKVKVLKYRQLASLALAKRHEGRLGLGREIEREECGLTHLSSRPLTRTSV